MKTVLNFGDRIIAIPGRVVGDVLNNASREQLAVLLAVATNPSASLQDISYAVSLTANEVIDAMNFWKSNGIVSFELDNDEISNTSANAENKPVRKKSPRMSESAIPEYSLEQTAAYVETHPEASSLVDCCSQLLGKILNPAEIKLLIGMMDYLDLTPEYILLLCGYCADNGKRSVRYKEKTAISLFDSGITEYTQLEAHLEKTKRAHTAESSIRNMFGIGDRAFTKKETASVFKWIGEWNLPLDMIEEAYEITVAQADKVSIRYAHAILENWHTQGYKTLDEVKAALEAYKKSKDASASGTFDTDDFFEAALKRSYK